MAEVLDLTRAFLSGEAAENGESVHEGEMGARNGGAGRCFLPQLHALVN